MMWGQVKKTKNMVGCGLFGDLGLQYVGPVDGHNVRELVSTFEDVKQRCKNNNNNNKGPFLIHVFTQKGKGYPPAEAAPDRMHGMFILTLALLFFLLLNIYIFKNQIVILHYVLCIC